MRHFVKSVLCLIFGLIVVSVFQASYKISSRSMNVNRYDPKPIVPNTEYRNYFKNKHVTNVGVYPLTNGYNHTVNERKYNSVIPAKYYRTSDRSIHKFRWILNSPLFCIKPSSDEPDEIYLIVTVASAIWEFERRKIIRKTWGSVNLYQNKSIKFVFFVGYSETHDSTIRAESIEYNDIVMEDFSEAYKNLTIKTQGQLKWITHFCPNVKYVLHVDDDVVPNIFGIVSHLIQTPAQNVVHCAKWFAPKVRREGKWAVKMKEYRGPTYPLSCYGWCYAMSADTATDLYYTSLRSNLLHIEDVMFTGILRTRLGIGITKMNGGEELCQHKGWPKDRPTNEKLLEAWADLQKSKTFQ